VCECVCECVCVSVSLSVCVSVYVCVCVWCVCVTNLLSLEKGCVGGGGHLHREVVISQLGRWKRFLVSAFQTPVNFSIHESVQSTVNSEQSMC
jgi:hypothetical protein